MFANFCSKFQRITSGNEWSFVGIHWLGTEAFAVKARESFITVTSIWYFYIIIEKIASAETYFCALFASKLIIMGLWNSTAIVSVKYSWK